MINEHRTKEIFQSLSLHFKSNYDYIKYNGHLKNITCRENEFWFISLSKRLMTEENVKEFFIANFVNTFVKDNKIETFGKSFSNKENFVIRDLWLKRVKNGAIEVNFENVLNKIDIKKDLKVEKDSYPEIYSKYLDGTVSLEFMVCIDLVSPKIYDYWLKNINDPVLFPTFVKFVKKYKPFLEIDKNIIIKTFKENL